VRKKVVKGGRESSQRKGKSVEAILLSIIGSLLILLSLSLSSMHQMLSDKNFLIVNQKFKMV